MLNICIMAGARPNFVKVAPIVRAIEKAADEGADVRCHVVYSGCADDPTLEASLFEDLQMRHPDVYLGINCESLNELTGKVMYEFEQYLRNNPTDVVIVVDDLASTMAAAIVAKKMGVRLAHLVAGTRSFDISMPKEINRLVIDGLSDYLFTAGMGGNSILSREGAEDSSVYMVGNILLDTLRFNRSRLVRPQLLEREGIADGQYIVFTLNRKALIADKKNLKAMVEAVVDISSDVPVIAPLRGLAKEAVSDVLPGNHNIILAEPMPYLEFGYLTANAKGIITDSGNVAEEATFNNIPCITLNSYTEHIETVKQGTNVLVGECADSLREALGTMIAGDWKTASLPERWDGRSAERIVRILLEG